MRQINTLTLHSRPEARVSAEISLRAVMEKNLHLVPFCEACVQTDEAVTQILEEIMKKHV